MTLETIPPYDPHATPSIRDAALVLGGGVAGLITARVLADVYERVTVVERDPITSRPHDRRGLPQSDHVHALLEAGRATLEDLFPGYTNDVRDRGGTLIDAGSDFQYFHEGDFLANGHRPLPMLCASRGCFEAVIRDSVCALPNVTVRDEHTFRSYELGSHDRVTGVTAIDPHGVSRTFDADLVVDATGRASRTPRWLEENGFAVPHTDEVVIDLTYTTTKIPRSADDTRGFLIAPNPSLLRGGTAVPIEGDRWVVTLFGLHGDAPPTTRDGFTAFADSLPTAVLHDLLDAVELRGQIHQYPFPSSRRHRYERLETFPDGLLVTGDAVASFNPIYGQGMSVAALEALQLHHTLVKDGAENLAVRFFDRIAEPLDIIWRMTISADFRLDETSGPRPRGTDLMNRYMTRLIRTAHNDPVVTDQFARVLRLERKPTALLRPRLAARVLLPRPLSRRLLGRANTTEPPATESLQAR